MPRLTEEQKKAKKWERTLKRRRRTPAQKRVAQWRKDYDKLRR